MGGEVLLQVLNKGFSREVSGACLDMLVEILGSPGGGAEFLYSNDVRVLLEILLRGLPNHAGDAPLFLKHAECLRQMLRQYPAAAEHRRTEVSALLRDLADDE